MPPNNVALPREDRYRIANARVPVDLAPELASRADADRTARCDIVVDAAEETVAMVRAASVTRSRGSRRA